MPDNATNASHPAAPFAPSISGAQVFKKFIGYYGKYKFLFWFDLVCATLLACIDLAFPQLLNFFTRDFFLQPAPVVMGALGLICAGMAALYLLRTGCQWFIARWGHVMGARMEADMRTDLFEQYQRLSFSYYDKNNTGEMMSRLVTDLFDVSELAHHGPENIFICSLKIIGSFVLLFFINVPLTLIMLACTAVMAVYAAWVNYRKRVIFTENRRTMAGVNSRIQDALGGMRVVKSFGNEALEAEKFARTNRLFVDTKERSYKFMGRFHAVNSLFTGLLYTIVVVGGGYFMVQGQIEPTDLAIYALYIGIFLSPIEVLINFAEQFQKGYAGFRRFAEIMAIEPAVQDKPGAIDLEDAAKEDANGRSERDGQSAKQAGATDEKTAGAEMSERVPARNARCADASSAADSPTRNLVRGDIRYENVAFSYDGATDVLHGFTLHAPAGKTTALVGPSGGGKTTTCSLLPRFYDVREGRVSIDGADVRDVTLASLRRTVGIVQQDVYLFDGTIRDNILYGNPAATDAEVIEAAKRANIHDTIMGFENGYDTYVGERGARLSGGQKQRISIARVFLGNPPILILDEATSALDNESERHVQESLAELSKGRTTLVIAHRLSTIRGADKIAVVDGGRVVEEGTHDELIALGGTYARYCAMQFGV
ncbi:MAG: ABC transporter ATP-binding protein [Slackia sp.]